MALCRTKCFRLHQGKFLKQTNAFSSYFFHVCNHVQLKVSKFQLSSFSFTSNVYTLKFSSRTKQYCCTWESLYFSEVSKSAHRSIRNRLTHHGEPSAPNPEPMSHLLLCCHKLIGPLGFQLASFFSPQFPSLNEQPPCLSPL